MMLWNGTEQESDTSLTWMSKTQKSYRAHSILDGREIYRTCSDPARLYGLSQYAIPSEMAGAGSQAQNGWQPERELRLIVKLKQHENKLLDGEVIKVTSLIFQHPDLEQADTIVVGEARRPIVYLVEILATMPMVE